MGAVIAGSGQKERRMVAGSVPDRKGKVITRGFGISGLRSAELTRGRVAIVTREGGMWGRDTDAEWRRKVGGSTTESGRMASREDMEFDIARSLGLNMRARGQQDSRTGTGSRLTQTEVS